MVPRESLAPSAVLRLPELQIRATLAERRPRAMVRRGLR